jgi:hypothetical protein
MIVDRTEAFVGTSTREVVMDAPPALAVEARATEFPWMVQGFTTRGPGLARPFDLGLGSDASVAGAVLERGIKVLEERAGTDVTRVHLHLGPAICARCYEVGLEVFEALQQPVPAEPTPIDLRAVLARRAVDVGLPPAQITVSQHCTRCTESDLFSHRGGDRERQIAYIGILA